MSKRAAANVAFILVGIVLALAVLTVWGKPLTWMKNMLGTAKQVTTCGRGSVKGVCESSCDKGWVANPGYSCSQSGKQCCIPKDVSQKEAKRKKQFARFISLLQQCYQNSNQAKCETAADLVYELIPKQSNFTIRFFHQGSDITVDFVEIISRNTKPRMIKNMRIDKSSLKWGDCRSSFLESFTTARKIRLVIGVCTEQDNDQECSGGYMITTAEEDTWTWDSDIRRFKGFQLVGENMIDFSSYQTKQICFKE